MPLVPNPPRFLSDLTSAANVLRLIRSAPYSTRLVAIPDGVALNVGYLSLRQSQVINYFRGMKRISFFLPDGYQALDLAGPMAVFSSASDLSRDAYELETVGLSERPIKSNAGLRIIPDLSIQSVEPPHTLVFVGGPGARKLNPSATERQRLLDLANSSQRVVSICTGAFLAAELGLLDGQAVTTHWRHQEEFQERYPRTFVQPDRLYTSDGKFWSSAGVTAGIDLALALVSEDLGEAVAAGVARQLVVYLHREGGQNQYAEGLRVQLGTSGMFSELIDWIRTNLSADLSISVLSARLGMSERNFQRQFKKELGVPATTLVEQLRIEHAQQLLINPSTSISSVSAAVGFNSPDSFRRAFERVIGISPSFYQRRFRENG